ncbi:DUF2934 domain-containing protein [Roseomonas sp. USHLN139]|uniref:DUF2934 domain-containing protein n=1 Tax=Roseomonas sp. USHLN139 TaxID=3081298 RepID=UPI003B01981F
MGEDETRRAEIETRAYTLWAESGRPEGRAEEFWHLAKAQIEAEEQPADPESRVAVESGGGLIPPPSPVDN